MTWKAGSALLQTVWWWVMTQPRLADSTFASSCDPCSGLLLALFLGFRDRVLELLDGFDHRAA